MSGSLTERCLHFESALRGRNQSLRGYRSSRHYQRRVAASTRKTNSRSYLQDVYLPVLIPLGGAALAPGQDCLCERANQLQMMMMADTPTIISAQMKAI